MVIRLEFITDTIWAWGFVGKRRLEETLEEFGADKVEVVWIPYLLDFDPRKNSWACPKSRGLSKLVNYQKRLEDADQELPKMVNLGKSFKKPIKFSWTGDYGCSYDSHRLIQLAREQDKSAAEKPKFPDGKADKLVEELFKGHFEKSGFMFDHDMLAKAAKEAGLEVPEGKSGDIAAYVKEMLTGSQEFSSQVEQDLNKYQRGMSIPGCPWLILNGKTIVKGGCEKEVLLKALQSA